MFYLDSWTVFGAHLQLLYHLTCDLTSRPLSTITKSADLPLKMQNKKTILTVNPVLPKVTTGYTAADKLPIYLIKLD